MSGFRFGIVSIAGTIFIMINGFTGILTNQSLIDTAGFYFLNLIPIVGGDLIISFYRNKKSLFFVGCLFGTIFSLLYYPYIVYTYNEVMLGKLISPGMIGWAYFQLLPDIFFYTVFSAVIFGSLGTYVALKIMAGITKTKSLMGIS